MPDLRKTRQHLKIALAVMAGVDLLALIIYFSPLIGSAESRRQELNRLQLELTLKTQSAAPLRNLPEKVVLANHQIVDFYNKRFPAQDSEISAEFHKVAEANGVLVERAQYKTKDEGAGHQVVPVEIEANLSGSYASLARFINVLEQDQMLFIINSVSLGGEQQGPVKLDMRLEAYLKTGQL